MKLIALITIATADGDIPPGQPLDIADPDEAQSLIQRRFALAQAAHPEATPESGKGKEKG